MTTNDTCTAVNEALPWFVNGSLAEGECRGIRRHLESCEACRAEAELLAGLKDVFPRVPSGDTGEDRVAAEHFMQRVGMVQRQRDRRRFVLAASVLLAVATLGGSMFTAYLLAPRFQTVTTPAQEGVTSVDVLVRFREGSRLENLQQIMKRHGAEVRRAQDAGGWLLLSVPVPAGEKADTLVDALRHERSVEAVRLASEGPGDDEKR